MLATQPAAAFSLTHPMRVPFKVPGVQLTPLLPALHTLTLSALVMRIEDGEEDVRSVDASITSGALEDEGRESSPPSTDDPAPRGFRATRVGKMVISQRVVLVFLVQVFLVLTADG